MKWLALVLALGLLICLTTSATIPTPRKVTVAQTTYRVFLPMVGRQPIPFGARGLGLSYGNSYCDDLRLLNIQWYFDWGPNPNCPGLEAVPMVWGRGIPDTVGGTSEYLLGFNEPDLEEQANIPPAEAATLWREIETRFATKKLVSPVPSHLHPNWLVEFRDAYITQYGQPPRLDAIAAHCYMWTANACIALIQQYLDWADAWGVPEVWLTEFAFTRGWVGRSDAEIWAEAQMLINWMRAQPRIKRWAWWTNRPCDAEVWCPPPEWTSPLLDANGNLTFIGQNYRSY